jgi:hypothetical protein
MTVPVCVCVGGGGAGRGRALGQRPPLIQLSCSYPWGAVVSHYALLCTCLAAAYNNGCPAGFTSINQDDVGPECLKLKVRRRQPASGPSGKPVCLLSAAAATP